MKKVSLLLSPFFLLSKLILAQGFFDASIDQGVSLDIQNAYNGSGLSVYDINRDGWDDLTLCTPTGPMKFYLNNQGQLEEIEAPVFIQGNIKCALWADYDNDGDNDLLVTRYNATSALYKNIGDLQFEDISATCGIPQNASALTFGASWGDYDRDGLLDLYICNYNWPAGITNWLLHNEGNDLFSIVNAPVNDGFKRSFQSVFMDVDHDLIPEIHVINDKFLGNSLYEYGEDAIWTDISFPWNAALEMESMSNSICDFDHDSDLDIYVSNSQNGNALLSNNGTNFSDEAMDIGVTVNKLCWGSLWIDAENDSWLDLYVSDTWPQNELNNFFKNYNGTFTLNNQNFGLGSDETAVYACAKGDFNNDGFQDFVTIGQFSDGTKLWMNEGVGGNYITLDLYGTTSNADGIGSWVTLYAGAETLSHYTTCGDNYLSQNTHRIHFGLSDISLIDSLVIEWPSGITNSLEDLVVNQQFTFSENDQYANTESDSLYLCAGQCEFYASPGEEVLWDDGYAEIIREICEPGTYGYQVKINGIWFYRMVYVQNGPDPEWTIVTSNVSCNGGDDGAVNIITELSVDMDGIPEENWGALVPGTYYVLLTDSFNCVFSDSLTIEEPDSLESEISLQHVSCFGGTDGFASIEATGGTFPYEINWSDGPQGLIAGEYSATIVDANGCSIELTFSILQPSELLVSISTSNAVDGNNGTAEATVEGGSPPYFFLWSNGDSDYIADSLIQGEYTLMVTDSLGCVVSDAFSIIDLHVHDLQVVHPIYPNPSNDWIFLPENKSLYFLFDEQGRLVATLRSGYCDVSKYSPGMYLLVGQNIETRLIITR